MLCFSMFPVAESNRKNSFNFHKLDRGTKIDSIEIVSSLKNKMKFFQELLIKPADCMLSTHRGADVSRECMSACTKHKCKGLLCICATFLQIFLQKRPLIRSTQKCMTRRITKNKIKRRRIRQR
jgi:hypothetical protein